MDVNRIEIEGVETIYVAEDGSITILAENKNGDAGKVITVDRRMNISIANGNVVEISDNDS